MLSAQLTRRMYIKVDTPTNPSITGDGTRTLAVLAYGSLLAHPGRWLGCNSTFLIRCETPFGVEYGGRSDRRMGAPTLVRQDGASPVRGGLFILPLINTSINVALVREELRKREGAISDKPIREMLFHDHHVVYADFAAKITDADLVALRLAEFAIRSARKCAASGRPFLNGIRYLSENLEWGVETDLTRAYMDTVVSRCGVGTLDEAEQKCLSGEFVLDQVCGIDFTSAPKPGKPITVARGLLDDHKLEIVTVDEFTTWEAFENRLNRDGEWVTAIDFPFSQPRKLIENLGWPTSWEDCVEQLTNISKKNFVRMLREYQAARADGDRRHFRVVDRLAGSCSPMQLDFVPIAQMFFEGAPRLARSTFSIVPLRPIEGAKRIVVEGYPALVVRNTVGKLKYKADDRRAWTRCLADARRQILDAIKNEHGKFARTYGFSCNIPAEIQQRCVDNGTGDVLDAVLCAAQAAWALSLAKSGYGIPTGSDPLEGWIADPSLKSI